MASEVSGIKLPTNIKYIRDKSSKPIEKNRRYQLYTSLGLRAEIDGEDYKGNVWIKFYPPQTSQQPLDLIVENEANKKALEYVNIGPVEYFERITWRGFLQIVDYALHKLPEKAFDFCYYATKNVMFYVKH